MVLLTTWTPSCSHMLCEGVCLLACWPVCVVAFVCNARAVFLAVLCVFVVFRVVPSCVYVFVVGVCVCVFPLFVAGVCGCSFYYMLSSM